MDIRILYKHHGFDIGFEGAISCFMQLHFQDIFFQRIFSRISVLRILQTILQLLLPNFREKKYLLNDIYNTYLCRF